MRLVLHPTVRADVASIMSYYEAVAGQKLADEFFRELRHSMAKAGIRPESFGLRQGDLRRVNLRRFPYHFLFRIGGDTVRILVVRHHQRNPSFGVRRR